MRLRYIVLCVHHICTRLSPPLSPLLSPLTYSSQPQLNPDALTLATHATPEDAVCIHKDVNSRSSMGMHFATFAGSEDEVGRSSGRRGGRYRPSQSKKRQGKKVLHGHCVPYLSPFLPH